MTPRNTWIVGGAGALALMLAVYWYATSGAEEAVRYEEQPVAKGKIAAKVSASGTLSALVTVQVGSQVSGRVASLAVDFNSIVKKGQVLAQLDPAILKASVEQSRANHAAAKARLEQARVEAVESERKATRTRALAEQKLVAQADLDAAEAAVATAKSGVAAADANVEQTRAAAHLAEVNLTYATIVSPIDGIVISRSVDMGQTVAASLSAPTLFTIAQDLREMQVDTNIPEADVGKLREGMASTFTVDAWSGETFRGTVRQIRNAPQTLQNVVTYNAVLSVENPELRLRPGMTANVSFLWAEREDVVRVPNSALRFRPAAPGPDRPPAEGKRVWVLRDGKPAPLTVKVGVSDGSFTEILEGLNVGDSVITGTAVGASTAATPSSTSLPRLPRI